MARFKVRELSTHFEIEDTATGRHAHMSDGVDTIFDGDAQPLSPGSPGFIETWEAMLNNDEAETMEAYFPDALTLRPYGSPGKYEGGLKIDEPVFNLMMHGCDDEAGDAQTTGHYYMIRNCVHVYPPFADLTSDEAARLTPNETRFLSGIAGAIAHEDSAGFVTIEYFADEAAFNSAWERIQAETGCEES